MENKMYNGNKFVLRFSVGTIDHLGIQMYQTLPPVISELISNSYDADAEIVNINFLESAETGDKKIIVSDNGIGMSFEEINNNFLLIGRNRRQTVEGDISPNKKKKSYRSQGNWKTGCIWRCGRNLYQICKKWL